MKNIRIGDIILNEHAADHNPLRKSIVMYIDDNFYTTIYFNGKLRSAAKYEKLVVKRDPKFKIIGHVDINGFLMNAIKQCNE